LLHQISHTFLLVKGAAFRVTENSYYAKVYFIIIIITIIIIYLLERTKKLKTSMSTYC